MEFKDLDINISDNDGNLRDIDEVILQLKGLHKNFSTHAMSDYELYKKGQRDGINKVLEYLIRVAN